jgi:hypothetical protein
MLILLLTHSASAIAGERKTVTLEEAWARESPPAVSHGAVYRHKLMEKPRLHLWAPTVSICHRVSALGYRCAASNHLP